MLRRYLNFHLKGLELIYQHFMLKFRGSKFVTIFNVRSAILGRGVRFAYDKNTKRYSARDHTTEKGLAFYHERQANMAYKNGIMERGRSMGEIYFLSKIDFNQGDLIIDCGANVGDLYLWFSNKSLDVEYMAFEPSPKEYECLVENISPQTAINKGLWDSTGTLEFYVSSQGADSSLIRPKKYDEKIVVETVRLDSFISKPVKLLKLEAEGAEPEILLGLGEKIKDVEYIAADLGFERGVEAESTLVPTVNYLLNNGFELVEVSHGRICALFKNVSLSE